MPVLHYPLSQRFFNCLVWIFLAELWDAPCFTFYWYRKIIALSPLEDTFWGLYPPVPSILRPSDIILPLLPLLNLFSQFRFQVPNTSHCFPLPCLQKVCIFLKMQYSKIKSDSSRGLANSEWSEKLVPTALSDYIHCTRMLLFRYWRYCGPLMHYGHMVGMIHRPRVPPQNATSCLNTGKALVLPSGFQRLFLVKIQLSSQSAVFTVVHVNQHCHAKETFMSSTILQE